VAPAVTDRTRAELVDDLACAGAEPYRARQLFHAAHARRIASWDDLTELPARLRAHLAERFRLAALSEAARSTSADGTVKWLFQAADGQTIETVAIPSSTVPGAAPRTTICVSSQAGCAFACRFCATGQMGFARDLTPGEILEQVYRANSDSGRAVDNVVFMGMGEPLANLHSVVQAIRALADPLGLGFSPRRVTVSTSGLVPEIDLLAEANLGARLAVSLHAPTDELRSALMPINRRFPIADLVAAASRYARASGRRVSFEYVMLDGVNDADEHARLLADLLAGRAAHVNLIPYNQTASGFTSSAPARIRTFAQRVRDGGVPCTIRASRGRDIAAACGQLKAENLRLRPKQPVRPATLSVGREKA